MIVVGIDTSLTSTGIAHIFSETRDFATYTLKAPALAKVGDHGRLDWIRAQLETHTAGVDLAVIEGPAFGAKGDAYHQLAGLWWMTTHLLWTRRIPTAVVGVHPLKKYATGTTKADKDAMMLAAARRFDAFDGDNNAADALFLAHAGAEHLGMGLVDMPALNRSGLDAVKWPAVTR